MPRKLTPPPETGSADDVEAEFYEALQAGDLERLMAVWADDDEICCVHQFRMNFNPFRRIF